MTHVEHRPRVLLVDDEDEYRSSLAERLELRGFVVCEAASGEEALRRARAERDLDVVVLDYRMPGMNGAETMRELRRFRRDVPVIMLTAHGTVDTAAEMGRLGIFRFLAKPVPVEELAATIWDADRERCHALARRDATLRAEPSRVSRRHRRRRIVRSCLVSAGLAVLVLAAWLPPPAGLMELVGAPRQEVREGDPLTGFAGYHELATGESIADHYTELYGVHHGEQAPADRARRVASRTQLMIALIVVAAFFWATGVMPIGTTALLVGGVMYVGNVMRPDAIAQAFAKDAVVFIFGVLALSRVLIHTGLDRRVAMLLMRPVRGPHTLLFVFLPIFAVACSFISEAILVTLVMPIFLTVWRRLPGAKTGGNRQVIVLFALLVCYASNIGGPGSPAAGGRNAVMVGILADYGQAPTFLEWMRYGLPFVPVAALALAAYFRVAFARHLPAGGLDAARVSREASDRLGPLTREEKITAVVVVAVVVLWIGAGERLGMGGPVLAGLVVLNVLGVVDWREFTRVPWDVVFLYGAASALGKGLAVGGGALYLAQGFVGVLPDSLLTGTALPMIVSLLTGTLTNFMSDGATVAALGPITVPMAEAAGLHPWQLGFATAFASSFAHMLIIGTPASALVYVLCRDPHTGRQLVTRRDFLKHGIGVWVLSFAVLWGWVFLGYWPWLGFGS